MGDCKKKKKTAQTAQTYLVLVLLTEWKFALSELSRLRSQKVRLWLHKHEIARTQRLHVVG